MNEYASALLNCPSPILADNAAELLASLAGTLARAFLSAKNGRILQLALAEQLSQQELDTLLSSIDIETLHADDALLLAYAKQRHAALDFGSENEPRLKGLLQYHRFQNLSRLSFFSEVLAFVNQNGFVPALSSDLAMKYYEPEIYRILNAAGIVASSEMQYRTLQKKLQTAGYSIHTAGDCFTLSREGEQNRSMTVYKPGVYPWLHLTPVKAMRADCTVPSPEELVVSLIDFILNRLRYGRNFQGLAFAIRDLYSVMTLQSISLPDLKAALAARDLEGAYRFVSVFLQESYPGVLPMSLIPQDADACAVFLRSEAQHMKRYYSASPLSRSVRSSLAAKMPWLLTASRKLRG